MQSAVGTHRAAAAELLSQLLRSECPSVAAAIAASGLLPRCTALAVSHPNCNALHCSVVRCLRHALSEACGGVGLWRSAVGGRWSPAIAPAAAAAAGMTVDAAAAPPSPRPAPAGAAEGPCLAHYAAQITSGAREVAVGKRSPHVGFALATSELLQAAAAAPTAAGEAAGEQPTPAAGKEGQEAPGAEGAAWRQDLRALLAASQSWQEFAGAEGPLPALLQEQQVGGPGGQAGCWFVKSWGVGIRLSAASGDAGGGARSGSCFRSPGSGLACPPGSCSAAQPQGGLNCILPSMFA